MKKKLKPKAPRDLNIKDLITNPRKSGAHKDLKKEASKKACKICDDALYKDYDCIDEDD
jgi:hypothetical protein